MWSLIWNAKLSFHLSLLTSLVGRFTSFFHWTNCKRETQITNTQETQICLDPRPSDGKILSGPTTSFPILPVACYKPAVYILWLLLLTSARSWREVPPPMGLFPFYRLCLPDHLNWGAQNIWALSHPPIAPAGFPVVPTAFASPPPLNFKKYLSHCLSQTIPVD